MIIIYKIVFKMNNCQKTKIPYLINNFIFSIAIEHKCQVFILNYI